MKSDTGRFLLSITALGHHPLYKIGVGAFVVFGLVICSRMEYGRGISGIDVLQREASPDGAHEYIAYLTYAMNEQWWHLAIVPDDKSIFTDPQHQVIRLEGEPEVTMHWLSDTELQVTLPESMGIDTDAEEPERIGEIRVVYVSGE